MSKAKDSPLIERLWFWVLGLITGRRYFYSFDIAEAGTKDFSAEIWGYKDKKDVFHITNIRRIPNEH